MIKTILNIGLLLSIAIFSQCTTGKKANKDTPTSTEATEKNPEYTGVDFAYMNPNVAPTEDFYEFANGTWLKNNPVPESETRWSSFNELMEHNYSSLKSLMSDISKEEHEKNSIEDLLARYYNSYLDEDQRNKMGTAPIQQELDMVKKLSAKEELPALLAHFHNNGISAFFSIGVQQDLKDNSRHALYMSQSGMGLPSKDYYFKASEKFEMIRNKYPYHIKDILDHAGMPKQIGEVYAPDVAFGIEKALAKNAMSPVEQRNIQAQYNPASLNDLEEMSGNFNWKAYFKGRPIIGFDSLIISQPKFIKGFGTIVDTSSLNEIKAYLNWMLLNSTASTLSANLEKKQFEFYGGLLRGQKSMKPSWKRAIDKISKSALDEAMGHVFVKKHFSSEAKEKVNEMVDHLTAAYRGRIQRLEWMSKSTKTKALTKLSSFSKKLGYPDKWKDYSSLSLGNDSYGKNVMRCRAFEIKRNLAKLGQPIDKDEWAMPPHIVNAYYNPLLNEIVFPAGIMQPPFFDINAEDAVNYARMGAVIGHELTHGFDDQGAQFMPDGTFENWWKEEDLIQFKSRTQKLVNQFSKFEPISGVFVNGQLTLGENIADFGGLTIAYYAYQKALKGKKRTKIKGYTNEQRFFIAFAQIWKANYTESALEHQVNTNPHSPAKYRVIGPLSNMPEFFEAFDVQKDDPMRQPESEIAVIW